jgi:methionyl-tRNA formyltransferase
MLGVRIVFFGTPQFGVPSLRALVAAGHEIVLVVSRPDQPAGRHLRLSAPAVVTAARALGLPLAQPERLGPDEFFHRFRSLAPELAVVVAYGRLISPRLLGVPRDGFVNVHPSLLPRHRGPSPIEWAIASGDAETGVTTMLLDEGMDTGPVLLQRSAAIGERERAPELTARLADLGAELLVATLEGMARGTVAPRAQDGAAATVTPKLDRKMGRIDWSQPAAVWARRSRAFDPWPGLFCNFRGTRIKVHGLEVGSAEVGDEAPGTAGASRFGAARVRSRCSRTCRGRASDACRPTRSSSGRGLRAASASSDPRRAAVEVLVRVETRAAYAARLLVSAPPLERELVLGVLRWLLTLDGLLAPHLRTPLARLDPEVRACLRVGLYECARLRTPTAIAVDAAVRVAHAVAPRAASLVNAVLRRTGCAAWPDPDDETVPLAVRFSHPPWLVDRWIARLGMDATRTALAASQEPAPIWLLAAASDVAGLRAAGAVLEDHPAVHGAVRVVSGVPIAVGALASGRAYAMDPTAVAVARVVGEAPGPIVDLAAAPGGKSLVLAGEARSRLHVACDRHVGRVATMRRNLALAQSPPHVLVADGRRAALRRGRMSAVLLDAPCSGTGTLRRHPEIRWRLSAADIGGLAALQRALIAEAASLVGPGGLLLYATCSLEPEENEGVVGAAGLESCPVAPSLPDLPGLRPLASGGALIPPGALGDGFVVHLLRRPG